MIRAALVAVITAAVVPQALTYRPAPGPAKPVDGEFSYNFEITGTEALVKQLVTSNPILAISEIRATRKGQLKNTAGAGNATQVELVFDSSKVNGMFAGRPFQYEFTRSNPPTAPINSDPPRVFSFGLTMARRNYLISPTGDYTLLTQEGDAQAEAMAILTDAVVRLPDQPAKVGESWSRDWQGKRRQQNSNGVFAFKQTARLEELTGSRARISYTTTGVMSIPAEKNANAEVTTLDGNGTVVIDVATGTVIEADNSGAITSDLKKPGVKMVRRVTSKFKVS